MQCFQTIVRNIVSRRRETRPDINKVALADDLRSRRRGICVIAQDLVQIGEDQPLRRAHRFRRHFLIITGLYLGVVAGGDSQRSLTSGRRTRRQRSGRIRVHHIRGDNRPISAFAVLLERRAKGACDIACIRRNRRLLNSVDRHRSVFRSKRGTVSIGRDA